MYTRLRRRLLFIILMLVSLVPVASIFGNPRVSSAATTAEIIVEDPVLHPAYTTCKDSYWYPFTNNRGHTAYLTLNAYNPNNSTNSGEWRPTITQSGYYQVEAYIPAHNAITWCNTAQWYIAHDTTDARYTIHNPYGETTQKVSQYPLSNQWLNLGEFYFAAGTAGYVSLVDLNGEAEFSTTVSFSAMRFTFTRLSRPQTFLPIIHYTDPPIVPPPVTPPPDTGIIQAQGFDNCGLPSIAQMQTWWNNSPYSYFGLYLGGIHFASFCGKATPAWVSAVHAQGWSFIPTWVGPQAPCSSYKYKISQDPAVAYSQGRSEADLASTAAYNMGITNNGLGGTIIYYDLESYYGATLACRQAVASFMNGWGERLGELGNFVGGYGGYYSYITDWAGIAHVPQDVWIASWYANGYDPYASVYGITWLNGLWTNHQRLRQYAGEVTNTWGGLSMTIDINVADGMVAMPPSASLSSLSVASTPSIDDAGWASAEEGWLVSEHRLLLTNNRGLDWIDVSPAEVQNAYLLPTGDVWALSAPSSTDLVLYHSADRGKNWDSTAITLPSNDWKPLQLQFTSPQNGFIVLKKVTSPVFSIGLLLKTTDGGATWQHIELPAASQITFTSPTEAWLEDSHSGVTYHSTDGGVNWNAEKSTASPLAQINLPQSTEFSGWQSSNLGWAVTNGGFCSGEKLGGNFTCQYSYGFWQSTDGGLDWQQVNLPAENSSP